MKSLCCFFFLLLCIPPARSTSISGIEVPTKESGNYEELCNKTWTKRGVLDKTLYEFCMDQNDEGYEKVVDEVKTYANYSWMQSLLDGNIKLVLNRTTRDDMMLAAILHLQTESFLNLQYNSTQPNYDAARMNRCVKQWSPTYIMWHMVEFCYNRDK